MAIGQERDLDRVFAIELHAAPVLAPWRSCPWSAVARTRRTPPSSSRYRSTAGSPRSCSRAPASTATRCPRRAGRHAAPVCANDCAALAREHEVDGVLGQHRDQRQDRDREARRDVQLRDLGRPRQQERGPDDGQCRRGLAAIAARGGGTSRSPAPQQHRDRDGDLGASWMNVVEIVAKGRHSVSPATRTEGLVPASGEAPDRGAAGDDVPLWATRLGAGRPSKPTGPIGGR